jgi:hypothetical protein
MPNLDVSARAYEMVSLGRLRTDDMNIGFAPRVIERQARQVLSNLRPYMPNQ